MSDRDEKGRKILDWQELKGPFSAMKAAFGDGLQFHVYADNALYLCRPAGPYDNVDLGAFKDPFAKAEEIAATIVAPVEPPVLSLKERFAKIVDEAESLAAEFECKTPANGAPGYPHCAACCNGTMIQATCTEEFEFAAALDTLVVAGRRYVSVESLISVPRECVCGKSHPYPLSAGSEE